MKQKSNSFVLVVALVGFAASAWTANRLFDWKSDMNPSEAKVPTQFYAGMDKFLSNVSWMTLIQWQADDLAAKSSDQPEKLYQKLNALTNLDPLFADAYLDGALCLANTNPDHSLALLNKAIDMGLDKNWKVPFYAGQISLINGKNAGEAVKFYELAGKNSDAPDFVRSALIHAKCVQAGDDPATSTLIWCEYYGTITGPDEGSRRAAALSQINEYFESASADMDKQLQTVTEPERRGKLLKDRSTLTKRVEDVRNNKMPAPSTQPAI